MSFAIGICILIVECNATVLFVQRQWEKDVELCNFLVNYEGRMDRGLY